MKGFLTDRVDRFGALGQAALGLLRAEATALRLELEGTARGLVRVLLLFVAALFGLFWALGALIFALVEIGALWLPRWGAALILVAVLAVCALALALVARSRLRRLDTPAETMRRRSEELQGWWERRWSDAEAPGLGEGDRGGTGAGRAEPSLRPDA